MAPPITLKDDKVKRIIWHLNSIGISREALLEYKESDLDALVPKHLQIGDAQMLKIALRNEMSVFEKHHAYVGRLDVDWIQNDGQMGGAVGSCVLCGEEGLTVTALHTVIFAVNPIAHQIKKGSVVINVIFPNTSHGRVHYKAKIVKHNQKQDLALLKPIEPKEELLAMLDHFFSDWGMHPPTVGTKVVLLSFPMVIDQEYPNIEVKKDLPCQVEGKVTFLHKREALASYLCFDGCSGGLVVFLERGKMTLICGAGLHISSVHESNPLESWHKSNLSQLNSSLGQKASYGQFNFLIGEFIQSYLQVARDKKRKRIIWGQAALKRALKQHQQPEELDLFGPWPGLDDDGSS